MEEMLAAGTPRAEIVASCEGSFGMSPRATDDYIARVRARWSEEGAARSPHRRGEFVARMERLTQELRENQAWGALVAAQKLLADVQGLRMSKLEIEAKVDAGPCAENALKSLDDALREASAVGRALLYAVQGGAGMGAASPEAVGEVIETFSRLTSALRPPPADEGIAVH